MVDHQASATRERQEAVDQLGANRSKNVLQRRHTLVRLVKGHGSADRELMFAHEYRGGVLSRRADAHREAVGRVALMLC